MGISKELRKMPAHKQHELVKILLAMPYDPFERRRVTEKFIKDYQTNILFEEARRLVDSKPPGFPRIVETPVEDNE